MFGLKDIVGSPKRAPRIAVPRAVERSAVAFLEEKSDFNFADEGLGFSRVVDFADSFEIPEVKTIPISIRGRVIGGQQLSTFCGPKKIESAEQVLHTALLLARAGMRFIRAEVYEHSKFRRSGLSESKLRLLAHAAERFDLATIVPVSTVRDFAVAERVADIIELSPELSWNKKFLEDLSWRGTPVLLSRRPFLPLDQWLDMASIVSARGNSPVILLESGSVAQKGISLDLQTIIDAQRLSTFPVVVNCHSVARDWSYIEQLASAVLSAGADGIQFEIDGDVLTRMHGRGKTVLAQSLVPMMQRLSALRATLSATDLMRTHKEGTIR